MAITNTLTAQAATRTAPTLGRDLMLIGIFTTPEGGHVLVRTGRGEVVKLEQDIPQDGLTLKETGDGWAMVAEGRAIHRLVMA